MADSPLTSGQEDILKMTSGPENLLRLTHELYAHCERTGDWFPWRTIQALVNEISGAKLKKQSTEQTTKNMAAIMRKYRAHCRTRDAQQTKTAKKARSTRRAGRA